MKIRVTLKDPDGFYDCVKDAVKEEVDKIEGLDDDEKEELVESRLEDTWDELEKWVSYKEYVTIEFDTKEGTARVLEEGED